MRRLLKWFVQGLLLIVPSIVTAYVCWQVFRRLDSWMGLPWPGAGFLLTIVLVMAIGFLGTNLLSRTLMTGFESLLGRLPLVRLVYTATKDLLNAFVGEKRRFDRAVLVSLSADDSVRFFGFVTQESLASLGVADSAVVYVPQAYAIAGNTLVVPTSRITRLDADSSEVMAFIVSGGVTALPSATVRK